MQEDSSTHRVGPVSNRTIHPYPHFVGPVSNRTRGQSVRLETGPTETGPFHGLDDSAPIAKYSGHMPHWRQEGALYYVTFRLADSIPRPILESWIEQDHIWLAARGITGTLSEPERQARYEALPERDRQILERDQARRLFVELDRCHGACHLRDAAAASIVSDAMQFHDGKRIACGDYVVMPNHVHWLLTPYPGETLETILHSVKRHTALSINRLVGRSGALWQGESFDHIVRDAPELERIRLYIEQNPRKANLKSGEYIYYHSNM